MEYHKIIIVGSGPAGAACAWKLRASGMDCILLDKQPFPRQKVCAGWITPEVMQRLAFTPEDYPHSIITFNRIITHIYGLKIPIKTEQYSIRRVEFDDWLSKRSGAAVYLHKVKQIRKNNGQFIIDDSYCCQYLVGAAGTACPVYRTFFAESHPREKRHLIIALEDEFQYDFKEGRCHLWFFKHKLPGYAWYVPKGDGYLNIGIGGLGKKMGSQGKTITQYWEQFIQQPEFREWVTNYHSSPKGYQYYLRQKDRIVQIDKAYIIGDSAGIATKDLGEGIAPAVQSGILAANSIITGNPYLLRPIKRYSIFQMLLSSPLIRS